MRRYLDPILLLPLISFMSLGESLNFSEPPFSHLRVAVSWGCCGALEAWSRVETMREG